MKQPEQYPLQGIFGRLNDIEYCRYTRNGHYPIVGVNGVLLLQPLELLEVGRQYPQEQVMLAYFGVKPTRVRYFGEDTASMRRTVEDLRIPNRIPENVGELAFYLFRSYLKNAEQGSISFEQAIVAGKEHHFSFLLKKLLGVYKSADEVMLQQMQQYQDELKSALDT